MSRTSARKTITRKMFSQQMQGVWYDGNLTNRLRDESPSVYKDIGKVMRAQKSLTKVVRKLRPLLVYKGG